MGFKSDEQRKAVHAKRGQAAPKQRRQPLSELAKRRRADDRAQLIESVAQDYLKEGHCETLPEARKAAKRALQEQGVFDTYEAPRGAAYKHRPDAEPLHAYDWHEFTTDAEDLEQVRRIEKDTGIPTADLVDRALANGHMTQVDGRDVLVADLDGVIVELVRRLHDGGYHTYLRDGLALYDDRAVQAHEEAERQAWKERAAKNRAAYHSANPKPAGFDGKALLRAYRGPKIVYSRAQLKSALIKSTPNWRRLPPEKRQALERAAIDYVEAEVGWTAHGAGTED